ncbi:hypothetical protein DMN91_011022 [Ooceraea biroi]|uniref:BTB domain-containing protein n=1 Tax=Ooceraea biroi TaxID=2015173 RepID=A0A3L8DA08_OOCBI|nr:protein abrupt [Ooceraea biroi]RLU16953.1 hypothetical protein DMN91_011022 [Ooceraea biroi]
MTAALASKEFSLKWNNFSDNLTSGFLSHLSQHDLVDVTLAVEGKLLVAHKLVLSVCSPYFKNIFKEHPTQHPVIILKDVKYEELLALLKFMYQGEVNVRQEDLPTFLKVAQMLQIKGLEGGEGQIIPLLNDYVSDAQGDLEDTATLLDAASEQGSKNKSSDESVHSHRNRIKRSAKKRKVHAVEGDSGSVKESKRIANVNSVDNINLVLDDDDDDDERYANDSASSKNVTHDGESNDAMNDSEEIIELPDESIARKFTTQSEAVEPVTYRLSARGRPQLVHEGYVYNLTSRSEVLNRSHYRCAEQHRGCRGKCSVIAERFMPTGVREHNHLPGYQSEYDYRKKKGLDTDSV